MVFLFIRASNQAMSHLLKRDFYTTCERRFSASVGEMGDFQDILCY